MTMEQQLPPSVLDAVIVSPEDNEEDMEIVMKEYAEQLEQALRSVIEEGVLLFKKVKPAQRMQGYMAATAIEDYFLLLDENYTKYLSQGLVPQPVSPMWRTLAALPAFVWNHFASDFRALLRDHPEAQAQVEEGIRLVMQRIQLMKMQAAQQPQQMEQGNGFV